MELQIIDYQPVHQPFFEKLNKAWLEKYFTVEPLDKWVLENPDEAIIQTGGKIYIARSADAIVGTVALRFIEPGVYELTKMAVDKTYRGRGAGQFLCQAAIDKAREMGVKKLILYSNRVLKNAIHIYAKLGFVEIPVLPGTYKRSDIMMEIDFFSEQEIKKIRAETKGTKGLIHFNNAGASLQPDIVVETVIDYLKEEAVHGGYETEYKHEQALEDVYASIAKFINAGSGEIAIMENASTAWGLAFNGLDFKKGDQVITSEYEYASNFIGLLNAQKMHGIEIKVIPNDALGNFSLTLLEEAISSQTRLIAVTHLPSTSGGVLPIAEIGKIAGSHNILYMVDACQSIGQIPIDVKRINCDVLSVTGRKYLRAPRGTGFLYVRKDVQDKLQPILMDSHSTKWISRDDFKIKDDARRFELYEKNRALMLGLGKAVEYASNIGVHRIWNRVQQLAGLMRRNLANMEGITVHDKGDQLSGIVTFSVDGISAASLKAQLAEEKINVSVGLAGSAPVYMHKNQLDNIIRASLHYYNTEKEIKTVCKTLALMVIAQYEKRT